jgi:predicted GNAT family N-acyltransferase
MIRVHNVRTHNAERWLIDAAFHLVKSTGQVHVEDNILKKNMDNSQYVVYALDYNTNSLISVGFIKNPQKSYKRKVFERSDVARLQDEFLYELGYVATNPAYTGRGYAYLVVKRMCELVGIGNLYATTSNPAMRKIFAKVGFEEMGESYCPDPADPDFTIDLYVRYLNNPYKV